ncbi:hypothetical protein [Octadecabacter sp. R77987]|uniref:hypothetical protein n=1 Tax=Octadecabacter sp. R77987 TaxID=3093874 RepID=UPI00366CF3D2
MTPTQQAEATRQGILQMEAALAENSDDMAAHFHEEFRWNGNTGCCTEHGWEHFDDGSNTPLHPRKTV